MSALEHPHQVGREPVGGIWAGAHPAITWL